MTGQAGSSTVVMWNSSPRPLRALVTKPANSGRVSERHRHQAACHLADGHRTHLHRDLAGLAVLAQLRFVLQPDIESRQPAGV
jgi:hypothetical protein